MKLNFEKVKNGCMIAIHYPAQKKEVVNKTTQKVIHICKTSILHYLKSPCKNYTDKMLERLNQGARVMLHLEEIFHDEKPKGAISWNIIE